MPPCLEFAIAIAAVAMVLFDYLVAGVEPSEVSSINSSPPGSDLLAPTWIWASLPFCLHRHRRLLLAHLWWLICLSCPSSCGDLDVVERTMDLQLPRRLPYSGGSPLPSPPRSA
jgi:hypothetical protein